MSATAADRMTVTQLWSDQEILDIMTDAAEIGARLDAALDRVAAIGHPIPLRTGLGHWEQMRLDQRRVLRRALV